jgi:hypothetical protein
MQEQLREEGTKNIATNEEHLLLENKNLGEDAQQCVGGKKLKGELEIISGRQRLPN